MGKLVLYFPDGSTRDIPLTKERTMIGRRADNDVPLPSPAVSAEHAAVVTVLDDSFLEDLGSTNGTFVNDRPVTKHFLRDRDRIDVGRDILVYYADDAAVPEPLPPGLLRHQPANVLEPLDAQIAALEEFGRNRTRRSTGDSTAPRPVVAEYDPQTIGPMTGQVATEFDPLAPGGKDVETTQRVPARTAEQAGGQGTSSDPQQGETRFTPMTGTPPLIVRVVDGPNAGREIALDKAETLVGRVGVEVVALRRSGDAVELRLIESALPPSSMDARMLYAGDTFHVADALLKLAIGT